MSMTEPGEAQVATVSEDAQAATLMGLLSGKAPIEGPSEDRIDDHKEIADKRVDSTTDVEVDEPEEKTEAKADDKTEAKAEPKAAEDDFIEIPGEDGAEPTKIAVKDAIESHRQWKALEAQKDAIIERTETEARTRAQGMSKQAEEAMTRMGHHLRAVMQIVQPPQPPSILMLQQGQYYNPDQYNLERAQYEQAMARYNQVQQHAQDLEKRAKDWERNRIEENAAAEWSKLQRAWPDFADPAKAETTRANLIAELGKHYRVTPEKLNNVTNHEFFLIARDAIAYKNLKREAPQTAKKIEAKATVVKAKQEARADRARDTGGRFQSDAWGRFQKSGTDDDAAAVFEGLFKAKRTAR